MINWDRCVAYVNALLKYLAGKRQENGGGGKNTVVRIASFWANFETTTPKIQNGVVGQ
jgi:hypothetical protein